MSPKMSLSNPYDKDMLLRLDILDKPNYKWL